MDNDIGPGFYDKSHPETITPSMLPDFVNRDAKLQHNNTEYRELTEAKSNFSGERNQHGKIIFF